MRPALAICTVGLALLALFLIAAPPVRADGIPGVDGGDGARQLYVTVGSGFDLVESGRSIPIEVIVRDVYGIPQADVPVVVRATGGYVSPSRSITDASGKASFSYIADVTDSMVIRVIAESDLAGAAQGINGFYVRVVKLPPPPIYAQAEIVSAGVLGALVAFFLSDHGRSAFIGLFFPLYTRLKREEVLDHFVRGQIFGAVQTQPGKTFTEIRTLLGLSNGSLSYHLRMLEVQGFVRSEREGIHKRFFPAEMSRARKEDGVHLSDLQSRLLERLRKDPEATQRDLARDVGVTQQCVSYNLLFLRRQGSVDRVAVRGRRRYLVLEA